MGEYIVGYFLCVAYGNQFHFLEIFFNFLEIFFNFLEIFFNFLLKFQNVFWDNQLHQSYNE